MIGRKMICENLRNMLGEEIRSGKILPGTAILSTKQISEKYKVSFITANKAINALVEEGLLYRVHGSGTYVKETRENEVKENCSIGIISSYSNEFGADAAFGTYLNPAAEYLSAANCNIKHFSYQDFQCAEKFSGIDGLLVSHACIDPGTLKILEKLSKPAVIIQHENISDIPYNQVIPDLPSGMKEAAEHLYSNGHRKLYVASNDAPHSRIRIDAFMKAAENAGFRREDIFPVIEKAIIGDNGRLLGQKIGQKILKNKKCNALFSTSDFISFGILDRVYEAGMKPGKDLAIASYDDLESDALIPFGNPILTSIRNPRKEISIRAGELLLDVLRKNEKCLHIIKMPTKLMIRETSQKEQEN